MSETIRIPNIENYTLEILNGELVLKPKNLIKSDDEFINEQIARSMVLEYHFHGRRSADYELEICENAKNDERREFLKRQVGMIHQIKITLRKKFIQRFGEDLWNNLMLEYGL
jgi:hypothetical protein